MGGSADRAAKPEAGSVRTSGLPDGVELRYVSGTDALMSEVSALCYEALHRPFGVERCDDWDHEDSASSHLIALAGDALVGYGRLIVEGRWGHIRQLSVDEHWRGRGIGTALVCELVRLAREMRLKGVYLNARLAAVRMYVRLGFRAVGGEFPMPRTYLPHTRMEMPLR